MIRQITNLAEDQIIFDCFFMSQKQFVNVYGHLYPIFNIEELENFWDFVRDSSLKYKRNTEITTIPKAFMHLKKENVNLYKDKENHYKEQLKKADQFLKDYTEYLDEKENKRTS